MEKRWTDRQYHVQYNADVAHQHVIMNRNTNQFLTLPFCDPHSKSHGSRGITKPYHLSFDPKLVNGIFEIIRITCSCVACKSMLDFFSDTWYTIILTRAI